MSTPDQTIRICDTYLKSDITPILFGGPGIGKTDIVGQIAADRKCDLIEFHPTVKDPVDLGGLPQIVDEVTKWFPPDMFPKTGKGIFFMDELPTATLQMMAACFQLVLSRMVGGHKLGDGWHVVCAGNRPKDQAGARKLLSPLRNRIGQIYLEPNLKDWCRWAISAKVRPEIIAFLRYKPDLLYSFDPKIDEDAFPTPRTWNFVSRAMDTQPDSDIEFDVYQGLVGEPAALTLMSFLKTFRQLPSLDRILANPKKEEVSDDPAVNHMVATGLAYRADHGNFDNVVSYALRMPAEFSTLLMHDAIDRDRSLTDTPGFTNWAAEHGGF